MWQYAHHLSNVLPVVDPEKAEKADVESYCVILRKIFDYARNKSHDHLLEHLQNECRNLNIVAATGNQASKTIKNIHSAVIKDWSPDKYNHRDDYLKRTVRIIQLPLTKDIRWQGRAIMMFRQCLDFDSSPLRTPRTAWR